VRAPESARPGLHLLRGTITYQACDNRSCLFPASVPVTLPVEVTGVREAALARRGGAAPRPRSSRR
jgi:hypothetical protein